MKMVSLDDLHKAAADLIAEGNDSEKTTYILALKVLRHYLGEDWLDQYLKPANESVNKRHRSGRGYMQTDSHQDSDRYRHQSRVLFLAERLVNLQRMDGFGRILEEIIQGNLQSRFEELEWGYHLMRRGITFKFIDPQERAGKAPDLGIILPDGDHVYCEVKGKGENTELDANTLENSLKHARKQLPSGQPGIIFSKMPEEWLKNREFKIIRQKVLQRFFRNSERVVSVFFRAEESVVLFEGGGLELKFKEGRNYKSTLLTPKIGVLLDLIVGEQTVCPISLRCVVEQQCAFSSWVDSCYLVGAVGNAKVWIASPKNPFNPSTDVHEHPS